MSQGLPEPWQPEEVLALDDVISQYIRRVLELTEGKVSGKGGGCGFAAHQPFHPAKTDAEIGDSFRTTSRGEWIKKHPFPVMALMLHLSHRWLDQIRLQTLGNYGGTEGKTHTFKRMQFNS